MLCFSLQGKSDLGKNNNGVSSPKLTLVMFILLKSNVEFKYKVLITSIWCILIFHYSLVGLKYDSRCIYGKRAYKYISKIYF